MSSKKSALIVIDIQNDYFPKGNYPLFNAEGTLLNIEQAIAKAHAQQIPVILVQHVADSAKGPSPFFNAGSEGVALHPRILAAAPQAPVVVKSFADSFHKTTLEETLQPLGVKALLICGMMTQNCVTHTAISRAAEKYEVTVLKDCCTTVDQMINAIALSALTVRVAVSEQGAVL